MVGIHCFLVIVVSGERPNSSCRQFGGVMERNLDDDVIEVSSGMVSVYSIAQVFYYQILPLTWFIIFFRWNLCRMF